MAIQANFPAIKPSLMLDFANTKQLDSRITYTRASTASYYDGVTTSMAEQNSSSYSQEFDNAYWGKDRCTVTANNTTAPDGTSTAELVTEDTTTATRGFTNDGSLGLSAGTYTASIFVKAGTGQFMSVGVTSSDGNSYFVATFNITGVTSTQNGATGSGWSYTSASITSVGSSWYRCVVTGVAGSTVGRISVALNNTGTPTYAQFARQSYLGTGATYFFWGAQLEQRSAVTAYTATTTQAITNYIPKLQSAASGVARFDNNPTTGESLGLLIEESRTNLLTYSSQFDNAAWTKSGTTITADTIVAPDGTLTGDKLVEDTATSGHQVSELITPTTATAYTATVYVKPAGRNYILLYANNPGAGKFFDLANGTVLGNFTSAPTSASITLVGNGWYRCSITATTTSTSATGINIYTSPDGTQLSYTGNGFSGVFLWGAQLEAGAFATSYIPTVASQVTRAADSASITGTNFSSWYNQGEGTLYTETRALSDTIGDVSNGLSIGLTAGSASSMALLMDTRTPQSGTFALLNNSVSTGSVSVNTTMLGGSRRMGAAYATNNVIMAVGGVLSTSDTSTVIPTGTQLSIGLYPFNTSLFDSGYVQKIAYYPIRVTNAQLQALTS